MSPLSNYPNFAALEAQYQVLVDKANQWLLSHQILVACQLIAFAIIFAVFVDKQPTRVKVVPKAQPKLKSIDMSAIPADAPALNPPKDTPYTIEELKKFDGTVEGQPIYVAIKGIIFDVSAKKEMYGPGAGYSIFAGKDGSAGLGKSSLKPEDAIADYSQISESEKGVLDDWVKYFTKRYNIVGKVQG